MNDYQKERFARRVIHDMFDTVAGKHLAMFGYAFKKDTGDTRETAAAYVSKILLEEQAHSWRTTRRRRRRRCTWSWSTRAA